MKNKVRERIVNKYKSTKTRPNQKLTDKQLKFCKLKAQDVDDYEAYYQAYEYDKKDPSKFKKENIYSYVYRLFQNPRITDKINELRKQYEIQEKFGGLPVDKIAEIEESKERIEKYEDEWNTNIAFDKLKTLLISSEQTLALLSERPKLFEDVHDAVNEINRVLTSFGVSTEVGDDEMKKDVKDLLKAMENIEGIVFKLGTFNVREFNSTIATIQSLTKTINDLTGVSKNPEKIKSERFEDRLISLIETVGKKDFESNLIAFAFDNGGK